MRCSGKRPLGGKWIDHNKGDREKPNVRCRWVATEVAKSTSCEFFAATPPLEALRFLIPQVATREPWAAERVLLFIDVRKAHLHADCVREVFVQLPPEIRKKGRCARLRKCLYGTRDAPARWEALYTQKLQGMGFRRGLASASCFWHPSRDLRCVVHGDDFTFAGPRESVEWVRCQMCGVFDCKVEGIMGPGPGDIRQARILGRVITWENAGVRYEPDPRHIEVLVRDLALEGAAPLSAPSVRPAPQDAEEEEEPELPGEEALLYRRCAARLNYLSLDRPDCAFAAKELCRRMSCPTAEDMQALCRTVRYLAGCPRLTYFYEWQAEGQLAVCTDTDYAGCKVTRRSTSGGCVLLGKHMVRHWASTQRSVTQSSGEAELNGIVKGVCEGMGMRSLAADFGINLQVKVYADASAAIGICRRTGVGRVRHLAVGQLWVQDVVRSGEVALFKIIGTENPADISTNPQPAAMIARHLATMNMQAIKGRPVCAPSIAILQDGRGMVASACENSGAQ